MQDFLEDCEHYLRNLVPFKGNWYWEMQVLMVVIQWQHDLKHKSRGGRGFRVGRLCIWHDSCWKR